MIYDLLLPIVVLLVHATVQSPFLEAQRRSATCILDPGSLTSLQIMTHFMTIVMHDTYSGTIVSYCQTSLCSSPTGT
jgi:hypothetical protein